MASLWQAPASREGPFAAHQMWTGGAAQVVPIGWTRRLSNTAGIGPVEPARVSPPELEIEPYRLRPETGGTTSLWAGDSVSCLSRFSFGSHPRVYLHALRTLRTAGIPSERPG